MRSMTHYERLGVEEDADQERIREAYKKLRKEFHPDSRPVAWREHFDGLMKDVNEAYQTLSDEPARSRYDRKLEAERNGGREEREGPAGSSEGPAEDAWEQWEQWEEDTYEEEPHEEAPHEEEPYEEEPREDHDDEDAWERWERDQQEQDQEEPHEEADDEEVYEDYRDEDHRHPRRTQTGPPAVPDRLLYRLPATVHTAAIYLLGAWGWAVLWLAIAVSGGPLTIALGLAVAVGIPFLAYRASTSPAGFSRLTSLLSRLAGHTPLMASNPDFYARAVLKSLYLGPLLIIAMWVLPGSAGNLLFWTLSLGGVAAGGYLVLWIAEAVRCSRNRRVM